MPPSLGCLLLLDALGIACSGAGVVVLVVGFPSCMCGRMRSSRRSCLCVCVMVVPLLLVDVVASACLGVRMCVVGGMRRVVRVVVWVVLRGGF